MPFELMQCKLAVAQLFMCSPNDSTIIAARTHLETKMPIPYSFS